LDGWLQGRSSEASPSRAGTTVRRRGGSDSTRAVRTNMARGTRLRRRRGYLTALFGRGVVMAGGVQTAGPSAAAAPERGGGELRQRGTGEGSGYHVDGVVDARVDTWVPDERCGGAEGEPGLGPGSGDAGGEGGRGGRVARRDEAVRGMVTWRLIGTWWAARWGRCRRPSGLSSRLTTVEVTAIDARPSTAARRPVLRRRSPTAALASHGLEWSAARESRRMTRSNPGVGVAAIAM
jgi:hypothetical protein